MKKSSLGFMFAMVMMGANNQLSYPTESETPKIKPKIIPKGCKEYYFTKLGQMVDKNCTYVFFYCVASSDRVAKEKYRKIFNENK